MYVLHLRATKSEVAARDAEARFKNYVLNHPKLASTDLSKLTPAQLEAWRTALRELPTPQRFAKGSDEICQYAEPGPDLLSRGIELGLRGRLGDIGFRVAKKVAAAEEC